MNQRLKDKIKKIKLIATDVDGVLTDGGIYYSAKGDILKKISGERWYGCNNIKKKYHSYSDYH